MGLLLLAGTRDARQIALGLSSDPDASVVVSLPDALDAGVSPGLPVHREGFADAGALRDFLASEDLSAILDVSDPFETELSEKAATLAQEGNVEYLKFQRPSWRPDIEDHWIFINSLSDIPAKLAPGTRVFVAAGKEALDHLSGLSQHTVFCRVAEEDSDPFPLQHGAYVVGEPPFTTEDEIGLLSRLEIDCLVARNDGSPEGWAMIDAARFLGLRVAMLRRPLQPQAPRVDTLAAALNWARKRT